jgi:hypothetical protein
MEIHMGFLERLGYAADILTKGRTVAVHDKADRRLKEIISKGEEGRTVVTTATKALILDDLHAELDRSGFVGVLFGDRLKESQPKGTQR